MEKLIFKRVRYAKKNTPKNMMEYRIQGFPENRSPAGTRKEIYEWAKSKGIPRRMIVIKEECE